jgi:hypothetical protein
MSRPLVIAIAAIVALPAISSAQKGRQFKNSWFWGVKGGGFAMADSGQAYTQSPLAGVDWLITRTHGGLYISGVQSFFNQQTYTLRDRTAPLDSGFRVVDLKNLRKLDFALMGFPRRAPPLPSVCRRRLRIRADRRRFGARTVRDHRPVE